MASAERSDVAAVVREGECTPRVNGEPAKGTQDSASRLGLKDLTNFSVGLSGVRKRSAGSISLRSKPPLLQLKSNLHDFFCESKVHTPDSARKEDGSLELIKAAREEGIDDLPQTGAASHEMMPSGSGERKEEEEVYTRLFTAQNEHHTSRTFRRTQSQYEDIPSRKRPSLDGDDKSWDEATERKRSCAIVLTDDSTVNVEPEGDDDVFEAASQPLPQAHLQLHRLHGGSHPQQMDKEGSPMSELGVAGHFVMQHRANFERTLSASVLERGEFAPPLRDHPNLPNLPNIVYSLPLVPTKECQVHSVAFGCISAQTLAAEMHNLGLDEFDRKYVLIDCRYPYEYDGGHIKNAINLHDNAGLPSLFFPSESILGDVDREKEEEGGEDTVVPAHRRIPVFYCEYSQKRGPTMAHELRSMDRRRNIDRYPDINYDVMYLLECGYRNFYATFKESNCELFSHHCGYVEMKQEKKQLGKFKAHRKRGRARQLQQTEAASDMSPTTRGAPGKEGRRASLVAREKIRETLGTRLGGTKARIALTFDSEEEKSPVKKKEGLNETDL